MRKLLLVLLIVPMSLPLLSHPSRADEPLPAGPPTTLRVGLGGLISTDAEATAGALTLPIRVGTALRLEPEFGGQYVRSSDEKSAAWHYSLGLGLSFSWGNSATKPVFGFRLGVSEAGTKTSTEKLTDGGAFFGIEVGGEHFVTDAFSVGAEARLTYFAAGGGGVSFSGAVAARIYFD